MTAVQEAPETVAPRGLPPSDDLASERGKRERQLMLLALCFTVFLVTGNGVAVSPFLIEMARDLHTDLAAVANLVALSSLTWGTASLVAGAASDRLGRKPLLVGGMIVLILSPLGVALAGSYFWVAAWRMIGGIGGGTFMGTVFATVADRFPARERGRSLGWLTTGQSLSLVIGVPIITSLGGVFGWRGAFLTYGITMIIAAITVVFAVPSSRGGSTTAPMPFREVARLLGPRTVALLAAGVTERTCYASVSVFIPTYLVTTYGVSLSTLAVGLAVIATGNLFGTMIGGRLSDRSTARLLLAAISLAATALMALPALRWHPGLNASIVLCFLYTLVNAIGRPVLLAALSDVSGPARGAVMGLNITGSSVGWLTATTVGGPLILAFGFGGLGVFTMIIGLVGATLAIGSWLTTRYDKVPAV